MIFLNVLRPGARRPSNPQNCDIKNFFNVFRSILFSFPKNSPKFLQKLLKTPEFVQKTRKFLRPKR